MTARSSAKTVLHRDSEGAVRAIQHLGDPLPFDRRHTPQSLAAEYLRTFGRVYDLPAHEELGDSQWNRSHVLERRQLHFRRSDALRSEVEDRRIEGGLSRDDHDNCRTSHR